MAQKNYNNIRPCKLADFAQTWRISRQINDLNANSTAQLVGEVQFVPDGHGLKYIETGELTLEGGVKMQATRAYSWCETVSGDAAGIDVFFEDGRRFHHIQLGEIAPKDFHDCPPDAYHVLYDFSRWPVWTAQWRVKGPRKDYVSITRFEKNR